MLLEFRLSLVGAVFLQVRVDIRDVLESFRPVDCFMYMKLRITSSPCLASFRCLLYVAVLNFSMATHLIAFSFRRADTVSA